MFISSIIYKLPTIIYKSEIIYKTTTVPTNKDQYPHSTNINIGSIEPFYTTCPHTQHTATSLCPPSLFCSYEPYQAYACFTFLTCILT